MENQPSLSIILPCAGYGTRLNLETPKELYEIEKGLPLISFSLAHIKQALVDFPETFIQQDFKVILVIRKGKEVVYDYVRDQLPGVIVCPQYFNDDYEEWPGSIYSAQDQCLDCNVVLLPDSYLAASAKSYSCCEDGNGIIKTLYDALGASDLAFAAIPCETDRLTHLGALQIESNLVKGFQDKPEEFSAYNAFWGSYAFKKPRMAEIYQWMLASVRHQALEGGLEAFSPVKALFLDEYHDLGTWDRIDAFRISDLRDKLPLFPDS